MAGASEQAKFKAQKTYNAAADSYDAKPLAFWDRIGRQTIERIGLRPGMAVLDVCCGAGASAVPAAEAVGPEGMVIGVDLAAEQLRLGNLRAREAGLHWLEFRLGDMTDLTFPEHHFDAVVCVFGIFFVPDMEAQVAQLWRLVRPGGLLAITTWGPGIFAPAYEVWLSAVRRVRPDLGSQFNPWDRITTPQAVGNLFQDAGVGAAEVVAQQGQQKLRRPEDFWTIARGSGLRWTIDEIGAEAALAIKREILATLAAKRIDRVAINVIYAVASEGYADPLRFRGTGQSVGCKAYPGQFLQPLLAARLREAVLGLGRVLTAPGKGFTV